MFAIYIDYNLLTHYASVINLISKDLPCKSFVMVYKVLK